MLAFSRSDSERSSRSSRRSSPRLLTENLLASGRVASRTPPRSAPDGRMAEERYLATYGLVCNYYYNLVSWCKARSMLAIAVGPRAYWWDANGGVADVDVWPATYTVICCIACSSHELAAIAFADGLFCVFSAASKRRKVFRRFPHAVHCVCWYPDGKRLVAGDLRGMVYILECTGHDVATVATLPGLSQQICGTSHPILLIPRLH